MAPKALRKSIVKCWYLLSTLLVLTLVSGCNGFKSEDEDVDEEIWWDVPAEDLHLEQRVGACGVGFGPIDRSNLIRVYLLGGTRRCRCCLEGHVPWIPGRGQAAERNVRPCWN